MPKYAAVELGGMSIRVAVSDHVGSNPSQHEKFTTYTHIDPETGELVHLDPAIPLGQAVEWLEAHQPFDAIGIASFGPIVPEVSSETYGMVTKGTPKKAWREVNVVAPFRKFDVPILFDTDVNAPALHEYRLWKKVKPNVTSCAYITVGTGIGVGLIVNEKPVHGLMHPEAGHILFPLMPGETFDGTPNHPVPTGVESMTSAPALALRLGLDNPDQLRDVPLDHEVWDVLIHYVAGLCATLVLVVSPERIVIGGGIMANKGPLFEKIRAKVKANLCGYLQQDEILNEPDDYIVPASSEDAGLVGALALSEEALKRASAST
eukprot:m.47863 g.47863  ORF g.47863 m.47863 type:complete len:320 (+) comp11951_c0_seq1:2826-3785(+)